MYNSRHITEFSYYRNLTSTQKMEPVFMLKLPPFQEMKAMEHLEGESI